MVLDFNDSLTFCLHLNSIKLRNTSGFSQYCSNLTKMVYGSENVTVAELKRIKKHSPIRIDCMNFFFHQQLLCIDQPAQFACVNSVPG